VVDETFRDMNHHLASVTKAVTSILVGIAIDKGLIEDVGAPISSLLPEREYLNTDGRNRIQLSHMLTMTAGLQWDQFRHPFSDPRNDGGELYRCNDVVEYVLSKPMVSAPGEKFNYSNGIATVVGAILAHMSGEDVNRFAENTLFAPMGISTYLWTRYPDGSFETDGGLALRPRDITKIGQLLLDNGIWAGRQLVSDSWIRESTKPRVKLTLARGFGYYWNEMKLDVNGAVTPAYFTPGDGGQFLAVIPALNMVFAAMAGNYGADPTSTYWKMIKKHILAKFGD
jgi:CubicO group peptidase (beta-lactamase class C family)